MVSYANVTELPGNRAHKDQVDAMRTRYEWASKLSTNKDVLEVACGAGIGLGILARKANSVIGGDIDHEVLSFGLAHYDTSKIQIKKLDACEIELPDNSIDVVVCFEAIYYFPSLDNFLSEVERILRPDGVLLCSSVNCEWSGFNPSSHSVNYYSLNEMESKLEHRGFSSDFFIGFEDKPNSLIGKIIGIVRKAAVSLNLIPKTMKGKELLKRMFYSSLVSLPSEMTEDHGKIHDFRPAINLGEAIFSHKFYYFIAKKPLVE